MKVSLLSVSLAALCAAGSCWAAETTPATTDSKAATYQLKVAPVAAASGSDLLQGGKPLPSDKAITEGLAKVNAMPEDAASHSALATAYLQKARETNDPTLYTKAEESLKKAQELKPDDYASMHLQADLHSTRHQFQEAIEWVNKAIKINPNDPMNYGLLSDIYAELGVYDKAEDATQKMIDLKPGRASYSRGSYIQELYGNDREAIKLMRMAISAGSEKGEAAAWCHAYLGNLYFNMGYLLPAEQEYNASLASFPGFFHASAGIGQVKAARKDFAGAAEAFEKSLQGGLNHQSLSALIEVYTVSGQKDKAKDARERLGSLQKKYAQNGMEIDFEVAEADAEQGIGLPRALELAKDEVKTHANVKAYDALAWIALQNNDLTTAKAAMEQAMRLGSRNALFYYHAGKIQERLGNKEESVYLLNKALSRCPYFHDRYAEDARKTAAVLTKSLVAERMANPTLTTTASVSTP